MIYVYACLRGLWWSTGPPVYMQRTGVDVGCLITHLLRCFLWDTVCHRPTRLTEQQSSRPTHLCLSALGLQAQAVTPSFYIDLASELISPCSCGNTWSTKPFPQATTWHVDTHGHIQAQAYDIKHMNIIVTHSSVHILRSACLQFTHSATYICRYI